MSLRPDKDKGIIDKLILTEEKELMGFLSKLMDQEGDEAIAFATYSELAEKAKELGLTEELIVLGIIAEQEEGHRKKLQLMSARIAKM